MFLREPTLIDDLLALGFALVLLLFLCAVLYTAFDLIRAWIYRNKRRDPE